MKGYSLVEILVTMAVLAIGASLIIPGVDRARSGAQRTACLNNMRQIGQGAVMYQSDRETILPWCLKDGDGYAYWWESLAPYVGSAKKVFHCPLDKNFSEGDMERTVSYGWNYKLAGHGDTGAGPDFVRMPNYAKPSRVLVATDGPGGWVGGQQDSWGFIDESVEHTADPKRHQGLGNALFLDGHVEVIRTTEFPNNPLYQDRTIHLE
jgi:prepilin-type processing-associated H-X9-DG protein/prepilin-type N-terminal cleavage/methylation domain-containing protein